MAQDVKSCQGRIPVGGWAPAPTQWRHKVLPQCYDDAEEPSGRATAEPRALSGHISIHTLKLEPNASCLKNVGEALAH